MKNVLVDLLGRLKDFVVVRLQSKTFWLAIASLVLESLQKHGVIADAGMYQSYLDIAFNLLMAAGIVKTFAPAPVQLPSEPAKDIQK